MAHIQYVPTTVLVSESTRQRLAATRDAFGARSIDETIERLLRKAAPSAGELFEANRAKVLAVCRRNGLKPLTAFGSRVRDDRTPASDLDLVTGFPRGTSLLDVIRIQDELSQAFGCPVHLASEPERGSRLAQRIEAEGVRLVGPKT